MAIYHYSSQIISRGAGRSVVAAAAYRAAATLTDQRIGKVFDFTAKGGVLHTEILLPAGAPTWAGDRDKLWNAVEAAEKRKDSQLAREVNVALPVELTEAQMVALVREYAQQQFVSKGMVADVALHLDDPNNPHAHILLTTRALTADGFGPKEAGWRPDFKKGAGMTSALAAGDILSQEREAWAQSANHALAQAGHNARIDHRSLAEQGVEREATIHLGPSVVQMEARGLVTDRGDVYRKILDLNDYRKTRELRARVAGDAVRALTRQHSTFTEREVLRYVSKKAGTYLGGPELKRIAQTVLNDPSIVRVGRDEQDKDRFTSKEMQAIEQNLFLRAEGLQAQDRHAVRGSYVAAVLRRYPLSLEQEAALEHITSGNGLALIEGMAGTGKTYLLRAAREAWEEQGFTVRGATLAGKAAEGLQDGSGISSQTLHSLLGQIERGKVKLTANTILVVDEAGMVGSRQLAEVIERVEAARAKLVLVGDSRQLQPIDAGGAFRHLSAELGHTNLTDIRRQKDEWAREAVHDFAAGRAAPAIDAYVRRNLVTVTKDRDEAVTRIVDDWATSRRQHPNDSQIILAGTRAEVALLNQAAHEIRKAGDELHDLTPVRTQNGEREIGAGERILFLRNDRDLGVRNGTHGTVTQVEVTTDGVRLHVETDTGKHVHLDPKTYPYFDQAYAMTVHKGQGVTVDRAYVLNGPMHDRELGYVAMSRTREPSRLYITSSDLGQEQAIKKAARRLERSHQKTTSLDYQPRQKAPQERER